MRSETSLKSISFCAAMVFLFSGYAMAGNWETLNCPGTVYGTWVEGAGNGYICGYYDHGGFTYDGTNWTTYSQPDYDSLIVTAVWGEAVVGHLHDSTGYHGFLYDGATYNIIDKPGATSTIFNGINDSRLVGEYYASGSHGFSYDGTTWTTIDKPGADTTFVNGLYGNYIFGKAGESGFTFDGTTWNTYNMTGAGITEIRGISGQYIVGNYTQPANVWHNFLYDGSTWTTIDMPWSNGIIVGITGNTVAGYYNDESGFRRGAIYIIPEPASLLILVLGAAALRKRARV